MQEKNHKKIMQEIMEKNLTSSALTCNIQAKQHTKAYKKKNYILVQLDKNVKRFIGIYNLDSPVFSGVAFFAFLEETGVLEADSLALFFPCSTFKINDKTFLNSQS
jgi:hypothetical protein